jgi:hypothetical protein
VSCEDCLAAGVLVAVLQALGGHHVEVTAEQVF